MFPGYYAFSNKAIIVYTKLNMHVENYEYTQVVLIDLAYNSIVDKLLLDAYISV